MSNSSIQATLNNNVVLFWKISEPTYGCFSNWYYSPFQENGIQFDTTEHYLMYHKALLMGDNDIANAILKTKSPATIKDLGRKVKNWNEELWVKNRSQIMYNGIYLKCKFYPDILKTLLDTRDALIVEASPFDRIWGVGITAGEYINGKKPNGLNLLGESLMAVRKAYNEAPAREVFRRFGAVDGEFQGDDNGSDSEEEGLLGFADSGAEYQRYLPGV